MKTTLLLILVLACTYAKAKYKFCAPSSLDAGTCSAIERSGSQVECLRVSDSAECAIRLATGEADFGLFSADALLLAYQFYPNDIVPLFELRHKEKTQQAFEFQSVAIVPADFKPTTPETGYESLKNAGLCHPGYSKSQWWNDYILKYFERKTYKANCQKDLTAVENELENIKSFFGKACRPGDWASDTDFSASLKKKYPELCALCDDTAACKYNNDEKHGHVGALNCLTSGRGKVAYVALEYARQYFKPDQLSQYKFLCPDGSLKNLTSEDPCAWIKEPWGAIAGRKNVAADLKKDLNQWLLGVATYAPETWKESLKRVIEEDSLSIKPMEASLVNYLAAGRPEIKLADIKTCGNAVRWCTVSDLEKAKCEWIAKEAIALGIEPQISCWQTNSTFECFRAITDNVSDIMTIDSNYGYLARHVYNLTSVLYAETDKKKVKDSMIMAVLRKPEDDKYPIMSLKALKGRTACFPEYGGIAWLSFVKIIQANRVISPTSCDYPGQLSNLLAGACTPGILDSNHLNSSIKPEVANKLCSVCPRENGTTICTAGSTNNYYGDKGALTCLNDGAGEIAFVEIGNIKEEDNDANRYRILCKNGSLASTTGLNLDKPELCALSVTINSEVIGRKGNAPINSLNTILSLLKLEDWLGYRVYSSRVLHIYGKFNGTDDLLFKSSTIGLEPTTSTVETILAYKELFSHVDECSSAGFVVSNIILITLAVISIFSMK